MAAGAGGGRRGAKRSSKPTVASTTTTKTKKPKKKKSQQNHRFNFDKQQHLLNLLNGAVSAAHSFLSQNDLLLLPSQTLAMESLLFSTLLSLRKTLKPLPLPSPPPPPPPSQPQQQCWFHRFLSATSSAAYDPLWPHAFRMSKSSFTLLLRLLTPALDNAIPSVPANYVLAAALYRLAHGAGYKSVGRRFGLDSAEACRAFYTVCKAINEKLGHLFEFHSDIKRVVVGFGWISLPNCCGVLGFGRFGVDGQVLGKNGSVLVQALVDSEGRFLDVSAGWPSTLKPETILHQTKLYLGVEESRELLNGPFYQLSDGNSIPQYILGESGFPILPWLLTPYTNTNEEPCFSSMEKAFNSVHSRAMALVGTAFGRVRTRWQLLSKQWKEECMEFLPFVVVTGCLLHNFLIKCSEPMPDDEKLECLKKEELPVCNGEMNESGKRIRDSLANHLNRFYAHGRKRNMYIHKVQGKYLSLLLSDATVMEKIQCLVVVLDRATCKQRN